MEHMLCDNCDKSKVCPADKMDRLDQIMEGLTYSDIIKALEYCSGEINRGESDECDHLFCYQVCCPEERNGDIRWCKQWLMRDALNLIKKLK